MQAENARPAVTRCKQKDVPTEVGVGTRPARGGWGVGGCLNFDQKNFSQDPYITISWKGQSEHICMHVFSSCFSQEKQLTAQGAGGRLLVL